MNARRAWPLAAVIAILATGCSSSGAAPTPDIASLRAAIVADFPVLDGSTSDHPLGRMLACDLLGAECVWSAPVEANVERTFIPAASVPAATAQQILGIKFNATHGAYLNLIDGKADLLLEARAPSTDELAAARAKNVELDVTPIALDAFVFLANVSNPVDSVTLANIRDIYSGRVTTWKQVGVEMGDPAGLIHAYQRERNSGSQELMMSMVMKETAMIDAPDMIVKTMLGPFNAIGGDPLTGAGGDPLGFGYSVYFYAAVMFDNQRVKIIGVEGVKPDSGTIASRSYPLAADVYAVTIKGAPADSPGVRFRDWLLTPDGQRAAKLSGYVGLPES